MIGLLLVAALGAGAAATERAESQAAEAVRLAASQPAEAVELAQQALALTVEFEPTAFVEAGRKGEVVEDAYLAARRQYRRHRSRLYAAVGRCLAAAGRHVAAARYLGRATLLDPEADSRAALARSLTASGRARQALDVLLSGGPPELGAEALAAAAAAADALGLASLQAELDRARLARLGLTPLVEHRDGPLGPVPRLRLSTGEPFRFDAPGLAVVYVAEASCRTCSADLTALQRLLPAGIKPTLAPPGAERDRALRQAARLYRIDWPYLVGLGEEPLLGVPPPAALLIGRAGWSMAVVVPPLEQSLAPALEIMLRRDVAEGVPRPAWNGRAPTRRAPPAPPALLPEGLAPGEDEPAPAEFAAAVAAFRDGRSAEALELFEALEARGDGWLLPPEARLDRALCLAALGRRDAARLLLLRTGDSRFQDAVDRALEAVSARQKP